MLEQRVDLWLQTIRAVQAPAHSAPALRVHRNTVWRGWLDALAAQYPSVLARLGADVFDALARRYLQDHPPSQPVLLDMGHDFPEFLSRVGDLDAGPVTWAHADRAWTHAHVAADAPPFTASAFAALWSTPSAILTLHPSVQVLAGLPTAELLSWLAHRFPTAEPAPDACALLIHRLDDAVQATAIDAGTQAFLAAAAQRQCVADALNAALSAQAHLDWRAWAQWLWAQQLLCPQPTL